MYKVMELIPGPKWKLLASGLPRRSAGEAWLLDFARTSRPHGCVAEIDADDEHDALDAMFFFGDELRQFVVEREMETHSEPTIA